MVDAEAYMATVEFLSKNPLVMDELVMLTGGDHSCMCGLDIEVTAIRYWMELNRLERDVLVHGVEIGSV